MKTRLKFVSHSKRAKWIIYPTVALVAITEVSGSLWRYSWWHAVTAMGGILLVMAETALFLNTGDIQFE